jgi:hypothetical protein
MSQHIGALLDKFFLITFGLFALLVRPGFLWKGGTPEETKKRLKILRICGVLALMGGVASLLLMLL